MPQAESIGGILKAGTRSAKPRGLLVIKTSMFVQLATTRASTGHPPIIAGVGKALRRGGLSRDTRAALIPAHSALGSCYRSSIRSWGSGSSTALSAMATHLFDPASRDAHYGEPTSGASSANLAQYLLDLHDSEATFNFCGGMMFQLVLTDKLRSHLAQTAQDDKNGNQPVVWSAENRRMAMLPSYSQDASADNVSIFHGREVRRVPNAAGGRGFVLQLSFAGEDPEGWTSQEIEEYSGWLSDQQRRWRAGDLLESEGVTGFKDKFGPEAFTLHHRFYLHLDGGNRLWLSAEDGCEGTPAPAATSLADRARAAFFG